VRSGIFKTAEQAARNYKDAEEKELGLLSEFEASVTAGKVAKVENGVQYVGDGVGNLIPVPVGFSYLEGTKNTGFVIKNNTDNNEFVWVPVGDVSNYQRVAWNRTGWAYSQGTNGTDANGSIKITRGDLDKDTYYWTEQMPVDEKTSISTYGGFYIGRYEAGVKDYTTNIETNTENATNWTGYTGDNTTLVVQKNQEVWNYITRDKAIEVATSLYNKASDNVTSKLCSSYAWDSALKFIAISNSSYPTNYRGGNYSADTGGTGKLKKTGYSSFSNIYDMAGNTFEWTTENCSDINLSCVYRDGNYHSSVFDFPVSYRGRGNNVSAYKDIVFRVCLFI